MHLLKTSLPQSPGVFQVALRLCRRPLLSTPASFHSAGTSSRKRERCNRVSNVEPECLRRFTPQ